MKKIEILIGPSHHLTINNCKAIAMNHSFATLDPAACPRMEASYLFLKKYVDQRMPIYGINTQFGDQVHLLDEHLKNKDQAIYLKSLIARQENLIKSHCCGLGEVMPPEAVKVAMLLRANCFSRGYSGVQPKTVEMILAFLNAGIVPLVRRYGSIGASGDLVPLATIATAYIGGNVDVYYQGKVMKASQALQKAGLKKIIPTVRDGLAMINGTCFMTALASLAVYRLNRLFKQCLLAVAMSLESMLVIKSAYDPLLHQLKGHQGEMDVNDLLLQYWQGSQLLTDLDELRKKNVAKLSSRSKEHVKPVQDYYSLRSVAQGFGPFAENLKQANIWIEDEMNSVNDNPVIDVEHKIICHGANFMGYYITDACDILKMDIAQASTWIHALLSNLLHPRKSHGLPATLISDPTNYSGYRPIQLLAASIAVQNRKLAQSQQSFMLPTEGDNQDVNSLGTHAAIDLQESIANLEKLTAILLAASLQALEIRGIERASIKAQAVHKIIRQVCPFIQTDQEMTDSLNAIITLLEQGKI